MGKQEKMLLLDHIWENRHSTKSVIKRCTSRGQHSTCGGVEKFPDVGQCFVL